MGDCVYRAIEFRGRSPFIRSPSGGERNYENVGGGTSGVRSSEDLRRYPAEAVPLSSRFEHPLPYDDCETAPRRARRKHFYNETGGTGNVRRPPPLIPNREPLGLGDHECSEATG